MQQGVGSSVFPQEPVLKHSLSLLERQSAVIADLGFRALKQRGSQKVMEAAVEAVADVMDNEMCKVLELLPDKKALLLRAGVGWQPGLVGHGTVSAGLESQAGFTLMEGKPVVVEDLRRESRFNGPPLLHHHGVVSGLSTPIYTSQGPWGVIGTHSTRAAQYSQHDQDFLTAVANVVGAAVERERHEQEMDAARERLEQWDQMRNRFLHYVAHELRTPLTPLIMQLQFLDRNAESFEPQMAAGVRVARRGAQRLQDMVDDFVELTSLQTNAVALERERVDLADVARNVVDSLSPLALRHDVGLQLDAEPGAMVDGDAAALQRALAALVDTGVRSTRAAGTVRVKAVRQGDFAIVSVEDEGAGWTQEQAKVLFHPFSQAPLLDRAMEGLGIGLALAKEIVDLHGGQIGVDSPGPGRGSRFWFMIRLVEGERLTDRIRMER